MSGRPPFPRRKLLTVFASSVAGFAALSWYAMSNEEDPSLGVDEVIVRLEPELLYTESLATREQEVVIDVVDEDRERVTDGRVEVTGGSAILDSPQSAELGEGTDAFDGSDDLEDHQAGFAFSGNEGDEHYVALRDDQNQGDLKVEVHPGSDDHIDEMDNVGITVIKGPKQ